MRTATLVFRRQPQVGQVDQPMPFLVRHFAAAKPNRLAASIRIPVTAANRDLLRELRAAELQAWEAMLPKGGFMTSQRRVEELQ